LHDKTKQTKHTTSSRGGFKIVKNYIKYNITEQKNYINIKEPIEVATKRRQIN